MTTLDIILVRRHILGITPLDSPYKLLAADVNGSGTVTTTDITYMRRLILGNTNTFPAGLWRFVPSDYVFPNPANPWGAPVARAYSNVLSDQSSQDFTAIKLGDVNSSWTWSGSAQVMAAKDISPFGAGDYVTFAARGAKCATGEEMVVPIVVYGFTNVTSAQFTLQWNSGLLEYLGVEAFGLPDLATSNFGTNDVALGRLTFAWDDASLAGATATNGAVVFGVRLRARAGSGGTSDVLFADNPTLREVTMNLQVVEFASVGAKIIVAAAPSSPSLALRIEGGRPVLTILATSGTHVAIQRTGSLQGEPWTDVDQVTVGASAQDWTDATASLDAPGFYRVKVLQ